MHATEISLDTDLRSNDEYYILRVFDENGEVVDAWQFTGYSEEQMYKMEELLRKDYPLNEGFEFEW